jgi:site-specific recombinase XerD
MTTTPLGLARTWSTCHVADDGHVDRDPDEQSSPTTGTSAMSVAEARGFVVSLQEAGLSPSSVVGFVRGLRALSAWCAAEGLVAEDPLRRLPRPQVPSRLIGTLGPIELERLLAIASRRDRLIIGLLLDTGLRLSELAGLRIGDPLPDGHLRVRGKGGKERLVRSGPRPRPACPTISPTAARGRSDGTSITSSSPASGGRSPRLRSSTRTNPHTFRHTFAKLYLLNGGEDEEPPPRTPRERARSRTI